MPRRFSNSPAFPSFGRFRERERTSIATSLAASLADRSTRNPQTGKDSRSRICGPILGSRSVVTLASFVRSLKCAHLEHLFHPILIAKEQNASVLTRDTLNFRNDRVDYRSLVRIVRAPTALPTTTIVRLREQSAAFGSKDICSILTPSMTRTLPTVVSRIALVFFSDSPSALDTKNLLGSSPQLNYNVREQPRPLGEAWSALPSPMLTRPRSAKIRPSSFATVVFPVPGLPKKTQFNETRVGSFSTSSL